MNNDTIAAIATPVGQAGIGIIRISGPKAREIADKIFWPKKPVKHIQNNHLYLGHLQDPSSGEIVDEILLSFMKAPRSYTREDVIEINSHSGYLLLSKILQIILRLGARMARPGEFTLRGFLNGRIDLTQAEAVVDLINCQSEKGLALASRQLQGSFGKQIKELRQMAVAILAQVEAAIDFPEEERDILPRDEAANVIGKELIKPIDTLIEVHTRKRIWVDGVKTVIVGRVNAGKSSLLNRLLEEQRAIVTPIPGTTRDVIESTITIEGLPLCLADTAGFGEAADEAERIGLNLTEKKLAEADLLLAVIDQSRPINQDDLDIIARSRGKKSLVVINKIDLNSQLTCEIEQETFSHIPLVRISALTGQGLDKLRKAIVDCVLGGDIDMTTSHGAPNLRHSQALEEAVQSFRRAARKAEETAPMEIIAFEIRSGLDALGSIIGEATTEEVLDSIFSQFCLGK